MPRSRRLLSLLLLAPWVIFAAAPASAALQSTTGPATQPTSQATTRAAPPLAAGLQGRVEEILTRLDSDDYDVRNKAQEELLELLKQEPDVAAAVSPLRQSHPSPEVRTRVTLALASLEEHRLLGPTLVSLEVEEVTVPQLLAELEAASGVACRTMPMPGRDWETQAGEKITLTLDNVSFWEALRQVGEASGFYPVEHSQNPDGGLMFAEQGDSLGRRPVSDAGAFVVEVRRIYRSDSAQLELRLDEAGDVKADTTSSHNLGVQLRILVEPKVHLAAGVAVPHISRAVDENGQDLLSATMRNQGGAYGSGSRWSYDVNLMLDPKRSRDARRLAHLEGVFNVEVAREMARLDVDLQELIGEEELAPGKPVNVDKAFEVGPYTLHVASIQRQDARSITLEMTLSASDGGLQPGDNSFWQQVNQSLQSLRVVDATGQPWQQGGGQTQWNDRELTFERTYRLMNQEESQPARLQWEVPVRTATHQVPFSFEDLPLPELGM